MEDQNKSQSFSDITPAQIQDWKAKYGADSLSETTVSLPEEGTEYSFVVKKPNRAVMEAVAKAGSKNDIEGSNKILLANCVLGGDMAAIENDGAVYIKLLDVIRLLLGNAESTVKKL